MLLFNPVGEPARSVAFYAHPAIAMALLTFTVLAILSYRRFLAIAKKQYPLRYFKLLQRPEGATFPEGAEAAARNLVNLFEVPVLFYAVIPLLILTQVQDDLALAGLWACVGLRVLHSAIHLTVNRLFPRFLTYAGSCVALLVVWFRLFQLLQD